MLIIVKLALPLSSYPITLAAALAEPASSMESVRAPIVKPTTPPKVVSPAAESLIAITVAQLQINVRDA